MWIHSTCRDCGEPLHTTADQHGTYNTVHPLCAPRPTKVETLAVDWAWAVAMGCPDLEAAKKAEIDESDGRPPRLLDAALAYAAWGWPSLPLAPLGYTDPSRPDYLGDGKKPYPRTRGFKDANTDVERIRAFWERNPQANIGLPTGHKFDVIDIDVPDGPVSLTQLFAQEDPQTGKGPLPEAHGVVATSSGGTHFYVKPTGKGNAVRVKPGIDYRGAGGYVVAPPSTLGQPGRSWSWTVHPSPLITRGSRANA